MNFQSYKFLHKRQFQLTAVRFFRLTVLTAVLISLTITSSRSTVRAQAGWQWYKVDTHVHSSISADAFVDIGIHSQDAIANGYDAIFLSDHNGGSSFQINNLTANHMAFEDSYTRWEVGTYGSLSTTVNQLVTNPVKTGTNSLHLKSSSSTSGETYVWAHRGPNFRSGDIILKVSIYPTRIDPGSGLSVSVSIGGDPTVISSPYGYTTAAGVVSPGKSTVLVWKLGSSRAPSSDPNARVLTYPLGSYTLNTWNTFTINVSNALADIPAADLPLDYNGLIHLKMTAAANSGTAEGYFDTYSIDASSPVAPADEYVYRTSIVDDFNTSTFKVFPSYEMGQQKNTNRFNFGITSPSEYSSYTYGSDGILETQQGGYPAQLNHPGTTITQQQAINSQGLGADFLEVREQSWIDTWDAILQQGVQILGNWSSDTHTGESAGKAATYIYAPAFDFDEFIHSLYEGRIYNAPNNYSGRVIFNLDSVSQEPYPARYPVYVSDAQVTANAHMIVTDGLGSGYTMRWYRNGVLVATDNRTALSYDATRSISLTGAFTYVRAEVRSSTGSIKGMTQPIFFRDVAGLPTDKSFHVYQVTTASGHGYNRLLTKGITSSSWNAAAQGLSLTLEDPAGALVRLLMSSNSGLQRMLVNGASIPAANSLAAFNAATTSIWYYDSSTQLLYFKVLHSATVANITLEFGAPLPTPTPSPTPTVTNTPLPTNTPTATQPGNTFTSVADAYVAGDLPTTNYGLLTTLRTDASPDVRSYLRFNVQGLNGPVTKATLRVYANSTNSLGYQVRSVSDNTWVESTINYSNAPAVGSVLSTSGATSANTRTSADVTAHITGNGTYSLGLTSLSSTGTSLASRESGANAPQLIIETQSGSTATPSSTPTSTATFTPTNTPTHAPITTATSTSTPTDTPTATATNPNAPTNTPTPTLTPTDTPMPTPTNTLTNTPSATPAVTDTPTPTSTGNIFTFTPLADAYVNSGSPTSNYGSLTTLRADGSPDVHSYLRFSVQGLTGTVTRATLRVFANSASSLGCDANSVSNNTWTESTINYNNAPPIGSVLGSSGQFGAGVWINIDVTPYITGNGTYNLGLSTLSSTAISFASRESGANAPQLVIETSP